MRSEDGTPRSRIDEVGDGLSTDAREELCPLVSDASAPELPISAVDEIGRSPKLDARERFWLMRSEDNSPESMLEPVGEADKGPELNGRDGVCPSTSEERLPMFVVKLLSDVVSDGTELEARETCPLSCDNNELRSTIGSIDLVSETLKLNPTDKLSGRRAASRMARGTK